MKIAVIIVRVLMGLLFVFASVSFFLKLFPQPVFTGDMNTFMVGMVASGYLMTLIKVTELICGIAFLAGRFVPLATVVIFPVVINILMVHILLAPDGIPVAVFLLLANLFLAYAYRKHYQGLLQAK